MFLCAGASEPNLKHATPISGLPEIGASCRPSRPRPTWVRACVAGKTIRLSLRPPSDRLRQRKHRQLAAERWVVLQGSVAADGAEAGGRIRQASRKTDTGPAADTREDRNVLLAVVLVGRDVADDAGRGLELIEFLAG